MKKLISIFLPVVCLLGINPAKAQPGPPPGIVVDPFTGNVISPLPTNWPTNGLEVNGVAVVGGGGGGGSGNVTTTGSNLLNFVTAGDGNYTLPTGNQTLAGLAIGNQTFLGNITINGTKAISLNVVGGVETPGIYDGAGTLFINLATGDFPQSGYTFDDTLSVNTQLNTQFFHATASANIDNVLTLGDNLTLSDGKLITGNVTLTGNNIYSGNINGAGIFGTSIQTAILDLNGSPGNSTTLQAQSSGIFTQFLPAANTTLAGIAANQTFSLTNTFSGVLNASGTGLLAIGVLGTNGTVADNRNIMTGHDLISGGFTLTSAISSPNVTVNATNTQLTNAASVSAALQGLGLNPYSSGATYTTGQLVIGSDNNYYRAITSTTGNDPTTDAGSNWQLYDALGNVTLSVPSRFSTIATAMTFISSAVIQANDLVTIQVANGNYSYANTTINLQHPYGNQIQILGNLTSPTSVNITSTIVGATGPGFFYLNSGGQFGLIDGFKLTGPNANVTSQVAGVWARNNAYINLGPNMQIGNFYFEIYSADGSFVHADGDILSGGGDGDLFVYNNSGASFVNGTAKLANTYFAKSGVVIEHGSSIFATGANLSNNDGNGTYVDNTSSANYANATFNNNTISPMHISSSSIDVTGATWAGNGNSNVPILDGWAALVRTGASSPANFGPSSANISVDASANTGSDYVLTIAGGTTNGRGDLELDSPSSNADPGIGFRLGGVFKTGLYMLHTDTSLRAYLNSADRLIISTAGLVTIPGTEAVTGAATFGSTVTASGLISVNGGATVAANGAITISPGTTSGQTTLVAGTVYVATAAFTNNCTVIPTSIVTGGVQGALYITNQTIGTGFNITSTSVTDTSTVNWKIVK